MSSIVWGGIGIWDEQRNMNGCIPSVIKMSAKKDEAVEASQEEMICSNCSEKIIGKAMKVVS